MSVSLTPYGGRQAGNFYTLRSQIKGMVKIMQAAGILPKEITQENSKHTMWIVKPKRKVECGICDKDISNMCYDNNSTIEHGAKA